MRTKSLLLAAAALAAGIITSQAQSAVYSANIVGYVNQTFPAATYSLVVSPLSASTTNNAEQVLTSLHSGDAILTWNGVGYNYAAYVGPGSWVDSSFSPVPAPLLPPGQAFFYQTSSGQNETNTYVGSVVLTNSINFPAAQYNMVGSTAPVAGSIESTNFNLPLHSGDAILTWSGSGYIYAAYVGPGSWVDSSFSPIPVPQLSVGQGFFYQTSSGNAETWNQNLTVQ